MNTTFYPDQLYPQTNLTETIAKALPVALADIRVVSALSEMLWPILEPKMTAAVTSVINTLSTQVENQEKEIQKQKETMTAQENEIKILKKKQNDELQVEVDALEQYSRRINLRIFGIAESEGENTDVIVLDTGICKRKLCIDDVDLPDIQRSHRAGKQNRTGSPRSIIVSLCNYRIRSRVFKSKASLDQD